MPARPYCRAGALKKMARFEYTVQRSDRRTYSIKVTEENKIIVRAPARATQRDIENVVAEKRAWIERALAFNSANSLADRMVKDYAEAYVRGERVPVIKSTRNFIDGQGVHITSPKGFKAAYVNSLGEEFLSRFNEEEVRCGLHASGAGFRSYRSMWGCCDAKGNIVFNFKLLMIPPRLQRYVMVHELCHIVHRDHSAAFWQLVERFEPSYKLLRREIKKYNFLAKMY